MTTIINKKFKVIKYLNKAYAPNNNTDEPKGNNDPFRIPDSSNVVKDKSNDTKIKTYKMNETTKYFDISRRANLAEPIKENGKYSCPLCEKTFMKYTTFSFHYTQHLRKFECIDKDCHKTFSVIGNLKQHYSRIHVSTNNFVIIHNGGKKIFKCNKCLNCFTSEPSIHGHITKCYGYCYGVNYHH